MSDEDCNRALLRFFYEELWIKGNVEMILGLLAEDFVDHHALSGTPPGREGLAALVATWRTAFLDMCDPRALHHEWHTVANSWTCPYGPACDHERDRHCPRRRWQDHRVLVR